MKTIERLIKFLLVNLLAIPLAFSQGEFITDLQELESNEIDESNLLLIVDTLESNPNDQAKKVTLLSVQTWLSEILGGGPKPFETMKLYTQYDTVINITDSKIYYAKETFISGSVFDSNDWISTSAEIPSDPTFNSVTTTDLETSNLNVTGNFTTTLTKNSVPVIGVGGVLEERIGFGINDFDTLYVPKDITAGDITIGVNDNQITSSTSLNYIDSSMSHFKTVGSNNYDSENLIQYPNFLEGYHGEWECLANCTLDIENDKGVTGNALKIISTGAAVVRISKPTNGQLDQFVSVNFNIKAPTDFTVDPSVNGTPLGSDKRFYGSARATYQKVPLEYPMGSTSSDFIITTSGAGTFYVSNVEMKQKRDNSFLVPLDGAWESCGLIASDFSGIGTPAGINVLCKRDGNTLHMMGQVTSGTPTSAFVGFRIKNKNGYLTSLSPLFTVGRGYRSAGGSAYARDINYRVTDGLDNVCASLVLDDVAHTDSSTCYSGTTMIGPAQTMIINVSIPIAEWQDSVRVTPVNCLGGTLQCDPILKATINSNGSIVSGSTGDVDWLSVINPTTGNYIITFKGGLNSSQFNCQATPDIMHAIAVTPSSENYLIAMPVQSKFQISCTRLKNSINNYVISCDNTISSNETQCGVDKILNKPIFKRTIQTESPITGATTVTIATLATGLKLKNFVPYATNTWQYAMYNNGSVSWFVYYNESDGLLSIQVNGSTIRSGLQIPLIYTKP